MTVKTVRSAAFAMILILVGVVVPVSMERGVLSSRAEAETSGSVPKGKGNLLAVQLPRPAMNIDPSIGRGGGGIITEGGALVPDEGPAGAGADIVKPKNSTISIYVVQEGDTLSEIAEMFDVSTNTIKWANDIPPSGTIRVGQTLTILPVTGIKYTVKKGDTLASIAKRFEGDAEEIANFNELEGPLAAGTEILIPDGVVAAAPASTSKKTGSSPSAPAGTPSQVGYYLRPISGGIRTQGIHGWNGVDLAAPLGTPIVASAAGEVIVAREGGWNGGYGNYVVVRHDNGTQTLYAHASSVIVGVGQHVQQGQVIAYIGATGKVSSATAYHVHFEIRGGIKNPF